MKTCKGGLIASIEQIWKLLRELKTASVEPIIFLLSLATAFHNVVYGYGIYRVICHKLYSEDPEVDCRDLTNDTAIETTVQRTNADWSIQYSVSYMIPATIADIILGALGDRYGRKINIELGIFGMIIAVFPVAIIFACPTAPLYVLLIANVLSGLTGFSSIIVISSFAYLADTIIDQSSLTIRMTLMQVCSNAGAIFGPLLAGVWSGVLKGWEQEVIAVGVLFIAFLIGLLVLKQVPPAKMRAKMSKAKENVETKALDNLETKALDNLETKGHKEHISLETIKVEPDVENATHSSVRWTTTTPKLPQIDSSIQSSKSTNQRRAVTAVTLLKRSFLGCVRAMNEVWRTYTRPREGRARGRIIVSSVVIFIQLAADLGLRHSVFNLYIQKAPLNWNQDTIGFYNSVYGAMTTLGAALGILVFKKILNLADTTVALISLASGISECLLIAYGARTWIVFVSTVAGCLTTLIKPCLKSYVGKMVDADEVGKAFTIFGLAQNVAYLVSSVVFSSMYKMTLDVFPGSVYLFGAFMLLVAFGLLVWVHVDERRNGNAVS